MLEEKLIDASLHASAVAELPRLRELTDADQVWEMAYFTEEVRRHLFEALGGDTVLRGGLVIETTLDAELQRAAVAAVRRGLVELDQRQAYRGPLRKLEPGGDRGRAARSSPRRTGWRGAGSEEAPVSGEATTPRSGQATASAPVCAEGWVWPVGSRKGARPIDARSGKPPLLGVVRSVDRAAKNARGRIRDPAARPR